MKLNHQFYERRDRVSRLIYDVEGLELNRADKSLDQLLDDGKKLTDKCFRLSSWNIFARLSHSGKLHDLENNLHRCVGLRLQANAQSDLRSILQETSVLRQRVESLKSEGLVARANATACALPDLPTPTFGFDLYVEELKTIMFQSSSSLFNVCAPGGCGKTTLVTKLCQDKAVKAQFSDIIFFTVSSTPNIPEIARRLWARLINANEVPQFDSIEDAAQQLQANLKKINKPVLIVLDDVWSDSVLEKLAFKGGNIKTIITSRVKLQLAESTYCLKMLGKSGALALFSHHASVQDQAADNEFVEEVVNGCKGFPLALKVIGRSLKHQPMRVWRRTVKVLKEGTQIFDLYKDILDCLAPSITSLNNIQMGCFMDLSAFPENKKIPAAALVDIWVAVRELTEDEAYVALLELENRNLITLIRRRDEIPDTNESFRDLYVMQHPLFRDLAYHFSQNIYASNGSVRFIMNQREDGSWVRPKYNTLPAQLVSITGDMSLTGFNSTLEHAEVLILNFSSANFSLPAFLEKMDNLKVLIVINHNSSPAVVSNLLSLCFPGSLTRIRLEKLSIPLLSISTVPLPNLHKLTLVLCEVSHADDAMLDMSSIFSSLKELEIDYCNNLSELPDWICAISSLLKLSITNCPDLTELPDAFGELKRLVSFVLQACTALKYLPDSICQMKNLEFLDVSHCSSLEDLPEDFVELASLKTIDMRQCFQLMELPHTIKQMKGLKKAVCDEETASLWRPFKASLNSMEVCVLKETMNLNWLA